MKALPLFFIVFMCITTSCKEIKPNTQSKIDALNTLEKRNQFLEEIYKSDQKVRTDRTAIEKKYGFNSNEFDEASQEIIRIDEKNIDLIGTYLDTFGYPDRKNYRKDARDAPFIVLQHSMGNEYRKKYFPLLYKAYKTGDFDDLAFFLGRMHDFEFGYFMSFENPYTEETEIAALTKALGLTEIMAKIDAEL